MSNDFNAILSDELDALSTVAPFTFEAIEQVEEAIRFGKLVLLSNKVHNIQASDVVNVASLILQRTDKLLEDKE